MCCGTRKCGTRKHIFLEKQTHIFATDIVQRFVWGCAELRFGEATSNLWGHMLLNMQFCAHWCIFDKPGLWFGCVTFFQKHTVGSNHMHRFFLEKFSNAACFRKKHIYVQRILYMHAHMWIFVHKCATSCFWKGALALSKCCRKMSDSMLWKRQNLGVAM